MRRFVPHRGSASIGAIACINLRNPPSLGEHGRDFAVCYQRCAVPLFSAAGQPRTDYPSLVRFPCFHTYTSDFLLLPPLPNIGATRDLLSIYLIFFLVIRRP